MGSPNANVKVHELQNELREAGFAFVGQTGSHERWRAPDDAETISVYSHGTGREAGPKNVHNVRKALERHRRRIAEVAEFEECSGEAVKAWQASPAMRATGVLLPDSEGRVEPAFAVRLEEGTEVEAIGVEATGRTKRLLGSAKSACGNVFHIIQEKEWHRGKWPDVLMSARRKKRLVGAVVRRWREPEIEGMDAWVDVFWIDLDGPSFKLGGNNIGVPLLLCYSGPPVPGPVDRAFEVGRKVARLIFNRDAGGAWALGLPYRFFWALTLTGEQLWTGWGTQAEAVEAAEEALLSLQEASEIEAVPEPAEVAREPSEAPANPSEMEVVMPDVAVVKPADPEVGSIWRHGKRGSVYSIDTIAELQSSKFRDMDGARVVVYRGKDSGKTWVREVGEFSDGRFELIATPRSSPPVDNSGDNVAIPSELTARIDALVRELDTPAVRIMTGQPVATDTVVRMLLRAGLEAVERDLKPSKG